MTYTTRQGSGVSCLAQTGFAAFGKGVQLISGLRFEFGFMKGAGLLQLPRGAQCVLTLRLPRCMVQFTFMEQHDDNREWTLKLRYFLIPLN